MPKNISMRMEELFLKERQLMDEQASYTTLLSLKEETEWLLDLVENRLMGGESSDLERVWNVFWTPQARPFGWCWRSDSVLTCLGPRYNPTSSTFTRPFALRRETNSPMTKKSNHMSLTVNSMDPILLNS